MFIFGYGSLMSGGWETDFGCTKKEVATLAGFRRDFNKASVVNWGSEHAPGPTLGLIASAEAECHGIVLEFPDAQRESVLGELSSREGPSFMLEEKSVMLKSGVLVTAVVPMNSHSADTFIGDIPVEERARMASVAEGKSGSCVEYVEDIRDKLKEMDIQDLAVENFAILVSQEIEVDVD